jgi:hypothetical protein
VGFFVDDSGSLRLGRSKGFWILLLGYLLNAWQKGDAGAIVDIDRDAVPEG